MRNKYNDKIIATSITYLGVIIILIYLILFK